MRAMSSFRILHMSLSFLLVICLHLGAFSLVRVGRVSGARCSASGWRGKNVQECILVINVIRSIRHYKYSNTRRYIVHAAPIVCDVFPFFFRHPFENNTQTIHHIEGIYRRDNEAACWSSPSPSPSTVVCTVESWIHTTNNLHRN